MSKPEIKILKDRAQLTLSKLVESKEINKEFVENFSSLVSDLDELGKPDKLDRQFFFVDESNAENCADLLSKLDDCCRQPGNFLPLFKEFEKGNTVGVVADMHASVTINPRVASNEFKILDGYIRNDQEFFQKAQAYSSTYANQNKINEQYQQISADITKTETLFKQLGTTLNDFDELDLIIDQEALKKYQTAMGLDVSNENYSEDDVQVNEAPFETPMVTFTAEDIEAMREFANNIQTGVIQSLREETKQLYESETELNVSVQDEATIREIVDKVESNYSQLAKNIEDRINQSKKSGSNVLQDHLQHVKQTMSDIKNVKQKPSLNGLKEFFNSAKSSIGNFIDKMISGAKALFTSKKQQPQSKTESTIENLEDNTEEVNPAAVEEEVVNRYLEQMEVDTKDYSSKAKQELGKIKEDKEDKEKLTEDEEQDHSQSYKPSN